MEKIIILGHENPDVDSIVSGYLLEKILNKKGYQVEFVIPDETLEENTLNICQRNGLNPKNFQRKLDLADENNNYIEYMKMGNNGKNISVRRYEFNGMKYYKLSDYNEKIKPLLEIK